MQQFLRNIYYREAWLTLEALDPGELPPYIGSSLRGALGHLLRPLLCEGQGCGHDCQRPGDCRCFSLFEQSRAPDGHNLPKPLIVEMPNPELEAIAAGGPVRLPFQTASPRGGEVIPTLRNEHVLQTEPGAVLHAGLRLLGPASSAFPGILEALGRQGIDLAGIRFALRAAHDGTGRLLTIAGYWLCPRRCRR
jgi:hypothetical protein